MTSTASLDAETKTLIEASLNRFVDQAYEPSARIKRLHAPGLDHRQHWPALAELGVLALPVGEAQGGIGGSTRDVGDALEVLSRGLVLEPLVEGAVIAGSLLRAVPQAADDLAAAVAGELLAVPVGGRRGDALHCEPTASGWRLSGQARVVPGAAQADVWLVFAASESGRQHLLRVGAATPGVTTQPYRMMDGREACDLRFEEATLPAEALWLQGEAAEAALAMATAQAVSAYCADAAGAMQCLVSQTGEYLRTREQFGVKIGSFQALQHRFADMHMAALEARAMAGELARCIDAGDAARVRWLCFAAPAVVSRASRCVGHDAIQLHGGMGVTDELVISHYNARLVVLNQLLARWATALAGSAAVAAD